MNKLKQVNLDEIEELNFDKLNSINFEEAANPESFNYIVHRISYWDKNWSSLSDSILKNISSINPNEFILADLRTLSQYVKVLSNLPK